MTENLKILILKNPKKRVHFVKMSSLFIKKKKEKLNIKWLNNS